ncbi:hypothetical protein FB451DRAFT_950017, partial [Mycena latifolia]
LAHGVEPLFPFDIVEATYMMAATGEKLTTEELVGLRALQLMKRVEDLEEIKSLVYKARVLSVKRWEQDNSKKIVEYDFAPGALVLIRNSAIENELSRKAKLRYSGPMVVVEKRSEGAYILAELDGAVSKTPTAAFRVIPYHARSRIRIPVTSFI